MTDVVASSSAQPPPGPLTRSATAAKPAAGAAPAGGRQHGSETSEAAATAAPLSSAGGPSSPHPAPPSRSSGDSARGPITRKRAASINTEEANRPKIENLSLNTPSTASSRPLDSGRDLICLCTPAPKVPRPRNAFILYRQHHQAQVVQQNPGLANPDISKIIGELWRDEPEERKNQWKLLAEEEKQRHQRQYPDYRYQPRRANKGGTSQTARPTAAAAAPGEDPHRCPKCGGRYIATPRTPSTPFMPTPTAGSKPGSTPYGPPPGLHPALDSSRTAMGKHGRPHWSGGHAGSTSSILYGIHEESPYDITSPNEAKRRRYNVAGSYHNFHALPSPPLQHTSFSHPPGSSSSSHPHPHPHPHPRQPSLSSNPPTPATAGYGPASALPGPSSMLQQQQQQQRTTSPESAMPPPPRLVHALLAGATTSAGYGHPPPYHSSAPPPHGLPLSGAVSVSGAGPSHRPGGGPSPPPPSAGGLGSGPAPGPAAGPPAGPGAVGTAGGPAGGGSDFDESLRLPPLQTSHLSMLPPRPSTSPDNGSEPSTGGPASGLGVLLHPTPTSYLPPSAYGAATGTTTIPPGAPGTGGGGRVAAPGVGGVGVGVGVNVETERDAQAQEYARSVEAMVMSISFVNKLRVLERISPPLGAVGSTGDGMGLSMGGSVDGGASRGPVIAIEGPDARLLRAVAGVVERALRAASPAERDGGWEVRCWEDRGSLRAGGRYRNGSGDDGEGDVHMSDAGSRQGSSSSSSGPINPFTAYLGTITEWHAKSAEIVSFVTDTSVAASQTATPSSTRLSTSSASSMPSSGSTDTTDKTKTEPELEETQEEEDTTPRPQRHPLPSRSHSTSPHSHPHRRPSEEQHHPLPHPHPHPHPHPYPPSHHRPSHPTGYTPTPTPTPTTRTQPTHDKKSKHGHRLPIALLPTGFALTLADRFACAVPIADAYAPVDHWQWMATLWRGIVGADLVVYVQPVPRVVPPSWTGGGGRDDGDDGDDGDVLPGGGGGTVEVRSAGLIVVRVPVVVVSSAVGGGAAGSRDRETVVVGVDEKVQRRLGFEMVEWVRSQGWVSQGRGAEAMQY